MYEYGVREVPVQLKIVSLFQGFSSQFGWLFFGFGMIFFWIFALNADISSIFPDKFNTETTGYVIDSIPTTMSENNRRIFRITFRFTDKYGEEHILSSYSKKPLPYNREVQIIYNDKDPKNSKIKGTREKPFGPFVLFVLLFPITGLIFIFFGIKQGIKTIRLLKYGETAMGTQKEMKPTSARINGKRVYKFSFVFKDKMGEEHTITEKTHLTHLLEGPERKQLLYLPGNPEYGKMRDTIPGKPEITPDGRIIFKSDLGIFSPLIIPILSIALNFLIFYFLVLK